MENEKLLESIRNLCKNSNISITKLEEELKFSQGLISRWKDKVPNLERIIDIADYFDVSIDEVIGRDQYTINNDFLNILYQKTINKKIIWSTYNNKQDESGIKQYSQEFNTDLFTGREEFEEWVEYNQQMSYYFEYLGGYISIYALYESFNIDTPREIKMFIQPDIRAELIPQDFSMKQLYPLWLKILTSLEENVPDKIKAEDLKQQFISG